MVFGDKIYRSGDDSCKKEDNYIKSLQISVVADAGQCGVLDKSVTH